MNEVLFWLKILGSVVILAAGSMIGYLYGKDITLHYEELCAFKRYFQMMQADVQYGGYSLQEIIIRIQNQCRNNHTQWLLEIINEIENSENQTFELIWNQSIERYKKDLRLNMDERVELIEVGMTLGSVDKEQQIMMITLYLDKLEYRIKRLQKDTIEKKKIYHLIGITGSIFLLIILL